MTLKEIKESGLLELYALDKISDQDKAIVEEMLIKHPSLSDELKEIEKSFEALAMSSGMKPTAGLKNKVLENIRTSGAKSNNGNDPKIVKKRTSNFNAITSLLLGLFMASCAFAIYQLNKNNTIKNQLVQAELECDSLLQEKDKEIRNLSQIYSPENVFIAFTATDNFKQTDLTLLTNQEDGKNYLKINNLPEIEEDEAFQLWSLKDGEDPIPMTVFKSENGDVIPLDFENGTKTYAITIETRQGATVPNLNKLIATVNV